MNRPKRGVALLLLCGGLALAAKNPDGVSDSGTAASTLTALCCVEDKDAKASDFKKAGDPPKLGKNVIISDTAKIKSADGDGDARAYYNHETKALVVNKDNFADLHEIRQKMIIRHEMRHAGQDLTALPGDLPGDLAETFKNMNALYGEIDAHIADLIYLAEYDAAHECDAAAQKAKDDHKRESTKNIGSNARKLARTIQIVEEQFKSGQVTGHASPPPKTKARLKVLKQCVIIAWEKHVKPWNDAHANKKDKAAQPTKLMEGENTTAGLIAQWKADTKDCPAPSPGS